MALGNVIGSNIFNILFVLGIAAAIFEPITLPSAISTSFFLAATMEVTNSGRLVPQATMIKQKLVRWEGVCMLLIYAGYLGYIINR